MLAHTLLGMCYSLRKDEGRSMCLGSGALGTFRGVSSLSCLCADRGFAVSITHVRGPGLVNRMFTVQRNLCVHEGEHTRLPPHSENDGIASQSLVL